MTTPAQQTRHRSAMVEPLLQVSPIPKRLTKARNKAAFGDGGFALELGGLHLSCYVDPRAAGAGAQGGVA
ncbi:hypothetical protein [Delftia tsuruhatensis]|jgi:hypothetical protein|uniref:hypothetical protein n=1 Tax=Delftia tsuruhatensis TaxID=180282 RepID=UPI00062D90AA|nr:hypothetical protein [Delftia tsuruhatensis]